MYNTSTQTKAPALQQPIKLQILELTPGLPCIVNMEAITVFGPNFGSKLSIISQTYLFPACKLSHFPLTPNPRMLGNPVPLKATSNTLVCGDEKNNREFRKLAPSEWRHHFLSTHVDFSKIDALGREIEALKPKVWDILMSSKGIKKKILYIYLLVTLGVAYHFEDEIEKSLKDGFQKIEDMMAGEDDLYTVSVIFYVLRTYGHNISSDVFGRFKGDNGEFMECLTREAKGILGLYEASHMGTTTDYILDEALSFTLSYLELLAASGTCQPNLLRRIRNALDQPQHKNMEIIVAMENIHLYEHEENFDKTLLKFAKLNFKCLQLHYVQELKILSKWYKEHDFESKLPPYFRDRFVEMHLVTLGYFEPKYSRVRIMLTKLFTVQIIIDDTCDRYASLREVESLASTVDRWDPDDHHAMDGQQDYLKFVVKFIFGTFKEYERELGSEVGGSYSVNATIESCKSLVRSNLQLAKWAATGHVPSFEKYLDVAGIEIAVYCTLAGTLMAMENFCKKEAYEWLESRDKLVRMLCTKIRILNDMFGFEDDMSRGYVTGSVNCYKKQYGVTEEEAFTKLHQMVVDIDKMMNDEFLKTVNVPHKLLNAVVRCLRMINVSYVTDDEFTRPSEKLKSYITSFYIC